MQVDALELQFRRERNLLRCELRLLTLRIASTAMLSRCFAGASWLTNERPSNHKSAREFVSSGGLTTARPHKVSESRSQSPKGDSRSS